LRFEGASVEELDEPERVPVATANADAALLEKPSDEMIVELAADDEKEELLATLELVWDVEVEVLDVDVLEVEVCVDVVVVLVFVLLWVVEVVLGGV